MKRIIWLLMAMAMIWPTMNAETGREKELRREAKSKVREMERGGWRLVPTEGLTTHYDRLIELGDDAIGFEGEGSDAASAAANAYSTYGRQESDDLRGRVNYALGVTLPETFYKAYAETVAKEIADVMQPSYRGERVNADGTVEVQAYFIVNNKAAAEARLRALNSAKKGIDPQYIETITAFVKEGYNH